MSVTKSGVLVENVVATIEIPASHHGTDRPETKNCATLRPARRPKNSAGTKHNATDNATISQSSVVTCIVDCRRR
jgi:hypothetical protein